jgi:hypothetical protein
VKRFLVAILIAAEISVVSGSAATRPPAPMPAPAPPGPRLGSITLSQDSVVVSGLQTVPVTIRVRLTAGAGVLAVVGEDGNRSPYVTFGDPGRSRANLTLTEGTTRDGVWSGQVAVTSAWKGPERATALRATDTAGRWLEVDPHVVIQVSSSHRPVMSLSFTPEAPRFGTAVTEHVRAFDTDTGLPWPDLPLWLGQGRACAERRGTVPGRTDAAGRYQRRLSVAASDSLVNCVYVRGPSLDGALTVIASMHSFAMHSYVVRVAPVPASVRAGTEVDVTGTVEPVPAGRDVVLLRRYGRVWRTVGTGKVRGPGAGRPGTTGTFTLVATPPGKGAYAYRVVVVSDSFAVGVFSDPFTIRAK